MIFSLPTRVKLEIFLKLFILFISYKIILVLHNVTKIPVCGLKSIKVTSFSCCALLFVSIFCKLFDFKFKLTLNNFPFLLEIITYFSPVNS